MTKLLTEGECSSKVPRREKVSWFVLFLDEGRLDGAHACVELVKPHTFNNAYLLGRAVHLDARILIEKGRFEEARSEALRAADVYEKFGATRDLERCRGLLQAIQKKLNPAVVSDQSRFSCEYLSSCGLCRALTLCSQFGEPIDGIDGCVDFFKLIFLRVTNSSRPSTMTSVLRYDYHSCPFLYLYPLPTTPLPISIVPLLIIVAS